MYEGVNIEIRNLMYYYIEINEMIVFLNKFLENIWLCNRFYNFINFNFIDKFFKVDKKIIVNLIEILLEDLNEIGEKIKGMV